MKTIALGFILAASNALAGPPTPVPGTKTPVVMGSSPTFTTVITDDITATDELTAKTAYLGASATRSTVAADGGFNFANRTTSPSIKRGTLYFDSNGAGALKLSLDGAAFVSLATGTVAGGGSVVANATQFLGDGSGGNPLTLQSSSVTLQGNDFNGVSQLLRLDGSGNIVITGGATIGANSSFTGLLGIRTASPAYPLDVFGDFRTTGTAVMSSMTAANFKLNDIDSFSRTRIHYYAPSSVLSLGSNSADGDTTGDIDSQGIIAWEPSTNSGARVKADRFGLTTAMDSALYYFRADKTALFYRKNPGNYILYVSSAQERVGIGTSNPQAALDVEGVALFGTGVNKSSFSTAGVLTFPSGYTPSAALDAATKGYVDTSLASSAAGWTKTGTNIYTSAVDYVTVASSFSSSGNALFSGITTFGGATSGISFTELDGLTADRTFNNGARSMSFGFTNPSGGPTYDGAFEIQADGAFVGDLLHVHQHTGNPGAGTDLVHLQADDVDPVGLHVVVAGAVNSVFEGGYVGISTANPQTELDVNGSIGIGAGTNRSTFTATGSINLANRTSAPTVKKGGVYFDANGDGALKVSLDGVSFVSLATGTVAGGGLTTVAANATQFTGDGTGGNPLTLQSSSVTLQGNDFNAASKLVKLDASGDIEVPGSITVTTITATGGNLSLAVSTFVITEGLIGIGTTTPSLALDLQGESITRSLGAASIYSNTAGQAGGWRGRRARGTQALPTAVQSGDTIALFSSSGHDGTDFSANQASLDLQAAENWTASAHGTQARLRLTAAGGTVTAPVVYFANNGNTTFVSSVTATALGVSGAMTASSVTLMGTSSEYNITTSTGIHMLGGAIKMEQGGHILWADGTISTTSAATAPGGGGGSFGQSSTTLNGSSGSTSDTSCRVCVAGSTLTVTISNNSRLRFSSYGPIFNSGGAQVRYLLNGNFIAPDTVAKAGYVVSGTSPSAPARLTEMQSAGTYSVCTVICATSGTTDWGSSGSISNGIPLTFAVEEVRTP